MGWQSCLPCHSPVVWVSQFSSLSLSVGDDVNTTSLLGGLRTVPHRS